MGRCPRAADLPPDRLQWLPAAQTWGPRWRRGPVVGAGCGLAAWLVLLLILLLLLLLLLQLLQLLLVLQKGSVRKGLSLEE